MKQLIELAKEIVASPTGKVAIAAAVMSTVAIGWCAVITIRRRIEAKKSKCEHEHLTLRTYKSIISENIICSDCGKKFSRHGSGIPLCAISEIRTSALANPL